MASPTERLGLSRVRWRAGPPQPLPARAGRQSHCRPPWASIAPANPAREAATAARCFLAEVNVVIHGGLDRIGIDLHCVFGEQIVFPRFRAQRGAAAAP